jgi:hypothetical protein
MAPAAVSRRPPISLPRIVARTKGYTYDASVWDLPIVQGPFSVAPCQTVPLRFATVSSLCGGTEHTRGNRRGTTGHHDTHCRAPSSGCCYEDIPLADSAHSDGGIVPARQARRSRPAASGWWRTPRATTRSTRSPHATRPPRCEHHHFVLGGGGQSETLLLSQQ